MLGGAPAAATLGFFNSFPQSLGGESLPFVVRADPAASRALGSRERSAAAVENLRRGRVFLESSCRGVMSTTPRPPGTARSPRAAPASGWRRSGSSCAGCRLVNCLILFPKTAFFYI